MTSPTKTSSDNLEKRKFDKVYILDTNIILNDAKNIYSILDGGNNLVVIPETTMDEIDVKKYGRQEINYQAQEFGRIIANAKVLGQDTVDDMSIITYSLSNDDTLIFVTISKGHYNIETDVHEDIINDRRILTIAKECLDIYKDKINTPKIENKLNSNIVFLSLDHMCRGRALSLGIKAEPLTQNGYEEKEPEYVKKFNVAPEMINELPGKMIQDIDKDYKIENYSYFFQSTDGNQLLAVIENGLIRQVDEDMLRNKEVMDIIPKNQEQLFAMEAMINRHYNIILIEALAGSGKTLISLFSALQLVRDRNNPYKKITYIRNSIESLDKGEDVGYLSGNEEKFKIYTYPLYDTLAMIARVKKPEMDTEMETIAVQELVQQYHIETPWVGEIRGRTITNSVVIIDEAQNMSKKSMQTVISRLDKSCKLIIIGSNRQIDNQYVNKYTNGLSSVTKASCKINEEVKMFATKLTKVVRGPITAWAEEVFKN